MRGRALILAAALVLSAETAVAQDERWVTGTNWLLDSGGHMGLIRSVIITRDGKQVVSAGEDRMIRVWNVFSGDTVRTIRIGVGQSVYGRVYTMALSPDERLIAVGGLIVDTKPGQVAPGQVAPAHAIHIYDFQSGKLTATLGGHENAVEALAFSPDGARLASASLDATVRLWDVAGRSPIRTWSEAKGPLFGVAFTQDGSKVVAGGADGALRLWNVETGALFATMSGHKDKVSALAVAKGGMIASASVDGEIRLWDGKNGKFLRTLAGETGETGVLNFNGDGKRLLSTCGRVGRNCISRVWDVGSGKTIAGHSMDKRPVLAAALSTDASWAATGGGPDNEIRLWNAETGQNGRSLKGAAVGLWAYAGGEKGLSVAWDTLFDPLTLNKRGLPAHALQPARGETAGQTAGDRLSVVNKISHGPLSLGLRREGLYEGDTVLEVTKEGKTVGRIVRDAASGLEHRAYSFTPNGEAVISGGVNGALSAYDLSGRQLGEFVGHEGSILAVATSRDGKYLISSASDHTVRLWNFKTRELIASVLASDEGQWIMWTPLGFYACSPGADHYLGWRVDHGQDRPSDDVAASQLRKYLNRPAAVIRAIEMASAEAAAKDPSAGGVRLAELLARPGPKIRVVSPQAGVPVTGETTELKVEVAEAPYMVKVIRVEVNGRHIAHLSPKSGSALAPGEQVFRIPLEQQVNKVTVIGVNDVAETVETVVVTRKEGMAKKSAPWRADSFE